MSLEKANRDYVAGLQRSEAGLSSADPGVEFYKQHHDAQRSMFETSWPAALSGSTKSRWLAVLIAILAIAVGLVGQSVQAQGSAKDLFSVLAVVLIGIAAGVVTSRYVPRFWKAMLYFAVGVPVAIALKLAIGAALTYGPTEFYARAWLDGVNHVNSVLSPLNESFSLRRYFAGLSGRISIDLLQLLFFVIVFYALSLLPWARRRMSLVTAVILVQVVIWLIPEILF